MPLRRKALRNFHGLWAAGMEAAARGRVGRAGKFAVFYWRQPVRLRTPFPDLFFRMAASKGFRISGPAPGKSFAAGRSPQTGPGTLRKYAGT